MQAMLDMHAAGTLEGKPANWFAPVRPEEELYDCKTDPYNVHNLASLPKYQKELEVMRKQLDRWMFRTGDMGTISEEEMVETMWPEHVQPRTRVPSFILNSNGNPMQKIEQADIIYSAPAEVSIYCPTQGASIGYTTDTLENAHWQLYNGPIKLEKGRTHIRAKAIRYGYQESEEIAGHFKIQ
jgi:hypothetical protein